MAELGDVAGTKLVCSIAENRAAFGGALVIFVARIQARQFTDINRMFVTLNEYDLRLEG